jgi:hypothetical protein
VEWSFPVSVFPALLIKTRSAILPMGTYPKEMKSVHERDISTPMFIIALFTIAKQWKYKCSSMDEWIKKKMWTMHTVECS